MCLRWFSGATEVRIRHTSQIWATSTLLVSYSGWKDAHVRISTDLLLHCFLPSHYHPQFHPSLPLSPPAQSYLEKQRKHSPQNYNLKSSGKFLKYILCVCSCYPGLAAWPAPRSENRGSPPAASSSAPRSACTPSESGSWPHAVSTQMHTHLIKITLKKKPRNNKTTALNLFPSLSLDPSPERWGAGRRRAPSRSPPSCGGTPAACSPAGGSASPCSSPPTWSCWCRGGPRWTPPRSPR